MTFWVRRTQGSDLKLDDLGQIISASSELDLRLFFEASTLNNSSDLHIAIDTAELIRITGEGGDPIPASEAFEDLAIAHEMMGRSHIGGTQGDVVYRGADGWANLPIGADGYVLVAQAAGPEWQNLGQVGTFGTNFAYVEDETESSTTSTEWQQKVRLSVVGVPAGTYRIGWTYQWKMSNSSFDYIGRAQLDDTTTLCEHSTRPADALSYHPLGYFAYVTLTAGDHFVDIDFKSGSDGKAAYIRYARVEMWRIS